MDRFLPAVRKHIKRSPQPVVQDAPSPYNSISPSQPTADSPITTPDTPSSPIELQRNSSHPSKDRDVKDRVEQRVVEVREGPMRLSKDRIEELHDLERRLFKRIDRYFQQEQPEHWLDAETKWVSDSAAAIVKSEADYWAKEVKRIQDIHQDALEKQRKGYEYANAQLRQDLLNQYSSKLDKATSGHQTALDQQRQTLTSTHDAAFTRKSTEYRDQLKGLVSDHEKALRKKDEELADVKEHKKVLEDASRLHRQQLNKIHADNSSLLGKKNHEIQVLEGRLRDSTGAFNRLHGDHQRALAEQSRLKQSHADKLTGLATGHQAALQAAFSNKTQELDAANRSHNEAVKKLVDDHKVAIKEKEQELDDSHQAHQKAVAEIDASHKTALARKDKEIEGIKQSHDATLRQHTQAMKETTEQLDNLLIDFKALKADKTTLQQKLQEEETYSLELEHKIEEVEKEKDELNKTIKSNEKYFDAQLTEVNEALQLAEKTTVRERSAHKKAVQLLGEKHTDEKKSLTLFHQDEARKGIEQLQGEHDLAMGELLGRHKDKVDKLRTTLDNTKTEAAKNAQQVAMQHSREVDGLKGEHNAVLARLDAKAKQVATQHSQEVGNLKGEHSTTLARLEAKAKQVALQHSQETNALKAERSAAIEQIQRASVAKEKQLVEKHQDVTVQLHKQVEDLNDELLNRDQEVNLSSLFTTATLPSLPDEKIKEQFLRIHQLVVDFARTAWKSEPEVWTTPDLSRASSQQADRIVKMAIVQDTIWTVLFHFIFCSPFRMLGEEGLNLESEWSENCGGGKVTEDEPYKWPPTGISTERWRYMTLKGCQESLSKPKPSSHDQRSAIRLGFKENLENTAQSMIAELENVMEIGDGKAKLIHTLCKTASIVWLDFEMHRCRIMVQLPGNTEETMSEKVAAFQKNPLKLTLSPLVGRYGNIKGTELETFSVIRGCPGEVLEIP